MHLHFLAAGCLFAWVIAGPDPAPRRPSVPIRLVVLGAAVAIHSTVAQLLYAGLLGDVAVPAEQLRGGAALMFCGGDIAEILLALPWSAGGSAWPIGPPARPRRGGCCGVERDVVTPPAMCLGC